ncbi:MAG: hypothetical protein EXS30_02200 [Pedosphaera sp.]|nr:hypothetical protein [Pedosphaera sp.]
MKHPAALFLMLLGMSIQSTVACDLCAVYSVSKAQGESSGFLFTAAEQFIPFRNLQFEGKSISVSNP